MVAATLTRTFRATHALAVAGGCADPHEHDYVVRFGFKHEFNPTTGLTGSKPLVDWDKSCVAAIASVAGQNLNAVLAPRQPTIEFLALYLFSQLPAYFDWVEVESYEPKFAARIERQRGARVEWLARRYEDDGGGPYGTPE